MIKEKDYKRIRTILIEDSDNYATYSTKFLIEPMKKILEWFSSHDVTIWCSDGTVLGLYRGGRLIDGDEDVDLSIDISTLNKDAIEHLPEFLDSIGFKFKGGLNHKNPYVLSYNELMKAFDTDTWFPFRNFKFISKTPFMFKGDIKMYAEIDIFCHYPLDGYHYRTEFPTNIRKHHNSIEFPIRMHNTPIGEFPIPNNIELYLERMYGSDWRIPKVANFSSKERFEDDTRIDARSIGDIRYNFNRNECRIFPRKFWSVHTCLTDEQLIV